MLLGKYEYQGSISSSTYFDYFPYAITQKMRKKCASEFLEEIKYGCEEWRAICELDKLKVSAQVLYRPFDTLSYGERTKILLVDHDHFFEEKIATRLVEIKKAM